MAIQFWYNQEISSKRKVVALNGAYHGDTFGAMAIGERGAFTVPFHSYLFDVKFIDIPTIENEEVVLTQFKDILKDEEIGTFIFEPLVQAAAGMRMYSATLLDKLIKEAQDRNVICIADEVFTGFGRTGKLFASDYLQNKPDIMAISKGLTGGTLPLGITSCNEKIVSAFRSSDWNKTFFHGHSYTANPIACAAANASFELLMQKSCQEQIAKIDRMHATFVKKIIGHRHVANVRNLGTILAVELKSEEGTSYFNELRKLAYQFFMERGILMRPLGNIIYVVPPYVIQENELKEIYDSIEAFLDWLK